MARCGDCNKFVGFEEQEPEINSIDIDEDGHVTVEVCIVNACDQCGTELTEANFNPENDHAEDCKGHTVGTYPEGEEHKLSVEETDSERTSRSDGKPGTPSRYRRSFYGFVLHYVITCSCGKLGKMISAPKVEGQTSESAEVFVEGISGEVEDEEQASGMDELS